MKKSVLLASAAVLMCYFTSCGGGKKADETSAADETKTEAAAPEYKLMTGLPEVQSEVSAWRPRTALQMLLSAENGVWVCAWFGEKRAYCR